MEGCNADEYLIRREEEGEEEVMKSETKSRIMSKISLHLKQYYKSMELLKSALLLFTSNFKVTFFMILSIVPFFVFLVFYEIKLYKAILSIPVDDIFSDSIEYTDYVDEDADVVRKIGFFEDSDRKSEFFWDVVEICLLYLVVYPLLELFSMALTVKLAARLHAKDTQGDDLNEVLYCQKYNPTGRFVTCVCVHLLSVFTLIAFLWIPVNLSLTSSSLSFSPFSPIKSCLMILSVGFHSAIFLGLLYKYLSWSAYWNMGLVICILEEETGIAALDLSNYYGKHFEQIGSRLMHICFAVGFLLRLPCLFGEIYNTSVVEVFVTAIVIALVCLKDLVKWIAVLLYFYDCKQQTLEKKVDLEGKEPVKACEV